MTDVRPPLPPDDNVTVLRPELDGPPAAAEPEPVVEAEEYPPDPEETIDTQEISLTELRAAALAAGVEVDEVEVPVHGRAGGVVDLAGAEREEAPATATTATDLAPDAEATPEPEPEPEPETETETEPDAERPAVATSAGPFGEPGAPVEGDADDAGGTEADGIDPRMQERRAAVTTAQLARRRRLVLLGVVVASAIGVVWLIVQSPFLSVQHVQVQGATKATRLAVEQAAAVKDGSALLFLDTGAIERRVQRLPWVAKASVSRDLPNGITITVVERLPVAWVRRPAPVGSPPGTLGPVAVVDVSGVVLDDQPAPPAGLPEIIGLDRVPRRGEHLASRAPEAMAELPAPLRAQTAALVVRNGQGVLQLMPVPGGGPPAAEEVRLGRLDEVGQKGAAALAVLDQLLRDGDRVRYVDVRVPGSPATR
jgi:cell division protein FtsQ